jgi:hypothetical protein
MPRSRVVAFVIKEIEEILPPIVFFAVGFNLVKLTTQLVLDDYLARFANYLVATGAALVVGKAVLLANLLPGLHRFDKGPLIRPILFKSILYTFVVFLVRCLEKIVDYWFGGGTTRYPRLCSASLLVALASCGANLGLRSVFHLHRGHRT